MKYISEIELTGFFEPSPIPLMLIVIISASVVDYLLYHTYRLEIEKLEKFNILALSFLFIFTNFWNINFQH